VRFPSLHRGLAPPRPRTGAYLLMKLIIVKWRDTIQDPSWSGHEELECPVIETVGWEAFQDEQTVKVGGTRDMDGNISGIIAIPMGCVLSCQMIPDF